MTNNVKVDRTLECEGLACPLPVVRAKKAMDEMKFGEVLEVRATDKGSVADLKGWANRTGNQYIGLFEENGVYRHYIRKAEASEAKLEIKHPHTATNEEVHSKMSSGEAIRIIDVREPAEYAFARIPGAISIPLGELEDKITQLDPDKEYYIVCRTGNRSDLACRILSEKGFRNVKNVIPGMSEWTHGIEQD